MRQFVYTVGDPLGIHARPAGLIVRAAKAFPDTEVVIEKEGNAVRATQLMKLMGMGIRQGDRMTVTAEGPEENEAIAAMEKLFADHL